MGRWLWLVAVAMLVAASATFRWGPSHTGLLIYLAAVTVLAVAVLRFVHSVIRDDQQPPTRQPGEVRDPGVTEGRILPRGVTRR